MNEHDLNAIRDAVMNAAQDGRKIAMFHYQVLIHANELEKRDPIEFCRAIGVNESYATEFRKMLNLRKVIEEFGFQA